MDSKGTSVLVNKKCTTEKECQRNKVGCVEIDSQKVSIKVGLIIRYFNSPVTIEINFVYYSLSIMIGKLLLVYAKLVVSSDQLIKKKLQTVNVITKSKIYVKYTSSAFCFPNRECENYCFLLKITDSKCYY